MRATFNLELAIDLEWDRIEQIRQVVLQFVSMGIAPDDRAYSFSQAVSELMENVCKYSPNQRAGLALSGDNERSMMGVKVANVARRDQAQQLAAILEMVNEGSPEEAYTAMVMRSMEDESISQLGLALIRHNCNADLVVHISDEVPASFIEGSDIPPGEDLVLLEVSLAMSTQSEPTIGV